MSELNRLRLCHAYSMLIAGLAIILARTSFTGHVTHLDQAALAVTIALMLLSAALLDTLVHTARFSLLLAAFVSMAAPSMDPPIAFVLCMLTATSYGLVPKAQDRRTEGTNR
jgi:hypothetical protein